ncbi:hypothetical protein Tco_1176340 [Tanacetum coccineum]
MMCTKMVPDEEDRVEKFIGGLPDNIQGNSSSWRLNTTIETTVGNNHPTNDRILEVKMLLEPIWLVIMRRMVMKEHFCSAISVSYTTKDMYCLRVITLRGLDIGQGLQFVVICTTQGNSRAELGSYLRVFECGHPFNIDLMPIDLGNFDVIIGMDWLAKNYAVIVCDEKISKRLPKCMGERLSSIYGAGYVEQQNKDKSMEKRRTEDVDSYGTFGKVLS